MRSTEVWGICVVRALTTFGVMSLAAGVIFAAIILVM